jgi:hypothetical protein
MPYESPPASPLRGFPGAVRVRPKTPFPGGMRARWRDGKEILEWDYQHGQLERYTQRGTHLGQYDPDSGAQTKPPDPSKSITP